jgi:hypothetical protein
MCPEKWLPFVLVTKKGVSLTTQECRWLRKTYRTGTSMEQTIDLAFRSAGSLVCRVQRCSVHHEQCRQAQNRAGVRLFQLSPNLPTLVTNVTVSPRSRWRPPFAFSSRNTFPVCITTQQAKPFGTRPHRTAPGLSGQQSYEPL